MRRVAAYMFDHPWRVLATWALILIAAVTAARVIGPEYRFDIEISGSESLAGLEILADETGPQGDTLTIVWKSNVDEAATEAAVTELTQRIKPLGSVAQVVSAYDVPEAGRAGLIQGQYGTATIVMETDALNTPTEDVRAIVAEVERVNEAGSLQVGVAGQSVSQAAERAPSSSEAVGIAFAAIVLILAFGSLVAAALPIVGSLVALGVSVSTVTVLTHFVSIPIFAPQLVALIGIGVGIDYALFVVSRHRSGLRAGKTVREAALDAMDTSGRAVLFAGVTVMISILGLLVVGIEFLNGLAYSVTIAVAVTMLVTVTAIPAVLAIVGPKVLSRRTRKRMAAGTDNGGEEGVSGTWWKWSGLIQAKPWWGIAAGTLVLAVLAAPAASMRLGSADAGTDPAGSTTRIAYDLRAEGFGEGSNAPILLIGAPGSGEDVNELAQYTQEATTAVAVTPVTQTGQAFVATAIPTEGGSAESTEELIVTLREHAASEGLNVYVSGVTAVFYDFAADLTGKLVWFLLAVLTLSSLLLMIAFRSIAVPVKAAAMNLLAAAATFGVLTAVFQWGWFANLLGVERTGPIDAFLPVMLLAILFGLSMDYQVFLVSRMREEWVATRNNTEAVRMGLAETGRVITAAALIMMFVFASFILGDDRIIKLFGFGLAVAIFIDAFIIRSLLVPSLMQVLGKANWWLPASIDRVIPNISIEPASGKENTEEEGPETGTLLEAERTS